MTLELFVNPATHCGMLLYDYIINVTCAQNDDDVSAAGMVCNNKKDRVDWGKIPLKLYFDRAHFGWLFSFASIRLHRIKRSFRRSNAFMLVHCEILEQLTNWRTMCWFYRLIVVIETWTKSFRWTNSPTRISSFIIRNVSFFFLIWHSIVVDHKAKMNCLLSLRQVQTTA